MPLVDMKSDLARKDGSTQVPSDVTAHVTTVRVGKSQPLIYPEYDYNTKRNDILTADSRDVSSKTPSITRDIGSTYLLSNFDDGFIRGGTVTSMNVALEDTLRVGKFLASTKGILWMAREEGLQLTNARPETRLFNPATVLLQTAAGHLGLHLPRHGLNPFSEPTYSTTKDYEVGGIDYSISDFIPVPRTMPKLDQMTIASFGGSKSSGIMDVMKTVQSPLSILGLNNTETSHAPADKAGGGAPFWPISYLGRVHSAYGLNLLDAQMNRVVNTQVDRFGKKINETTSNTLTLGAISSIVGQAAMIATDPLGAAAAMLVPSAGSPSPSVLSMYKTLAYGDLGVERSKYFSTERSTLTGGSDDYSYSEKLRSRKPSKRESALVNRGFPDSGNATAGSGIDKLNQSVFWNGDKSDLTKNTDDLIPFVFYDIKSKTSLVFRATIFSLSDAVTPNWTEYTYVGNPLTFYAYTHTTRQASFSFKAYTNSESELKYMWLKLSRLVGMCYPGYRDGRMVSPLLRLTIGDVYYSVPGFIQSLTLTIDDNTPWEINFDGDVELLRAPHVVECAVTYTIIGEYMPSISTYHFAQSKNGFDSWDSPRKTAAKEATIGPSTDYAFTGPTLP